MGAVAQHPCERRSRRKAPWLRDKKRGTRAGDRKDSEIIAAGCPQNRGHSGRRSGKDRGNGTDERGAGLVAGRNERHTGTRTGRRDDTGSITRVQVEENDGSCACEFFDEAGGTGACDDSCALDSAHRATLEETHAAVAQPLVRQLVDADLGIGASIRDLKANDLPGRGVRSQRCGSIHVETPLPHSKQIHTAHVGEART